MIELDSSKLLWIFGGAIVIAIPVVIVVLNWLNNRFEAHVTKKDHDEYCRKSEADLLRRFGEVNERLVEIKTDTSKRFDEIKNTLEKQNDTAAEDRHQKNNTLQTIVSKLAALEAVSGTRRR